MDIGKNDIILLEERIFMESFNIIELLNKRQISVTSDLPSSEIGRASCRERV